MAVILKNRLFENRIAACSPWSGINQRVKLAI
jgi:hypothetical protein